ncbi:hypothetical protein I204_07696 [Kwoniella mangroviensis CBS 8886]|nr:hypothetical protein I204_07696 [Kwoniella mangroviensis CBS 8886]
MNQVMRQIQTSLQIYQGGSMSSHRSQSREDVDNLVDSKTGKILADHKLDSIMQDKKRKRRRKEKEVVVVNQISHPPNDSRQQDDHPINSNSAVVERPKEFISSLSTPHIVGTWSGSPIKIAKKGKSAPLKAKSAIFHCPIERVHKLEENQGLDHQMTTDGVVGIDAGGSWSQTRKQSQG